jgi:subtilisin-like proprotein convertase family protein
MTIGGRRRDPGCRPPPGRGVFGRATLIGVAVLAITWTGVEGQPPERIGSFETLARGDSRAGSEFNTYIFSNPAPISIPSSGPASPYPSIAVGGHLVIPGEVVNVQVRLFGFSHTWPDDVDILLEGPRGQTVVLMSDVGGSADVTNIDLWFDDQAASGLPDNGPLIAGTYRPTNIGSGDPFPAPAPGAGPWSLSTFNGRNPVGTWRLYIVDDLAGETGSLSGGWSLYVTTTSNRNFDVAIDFGSQGLWTLYNLFASGGGAWVQRHNLSPTVLTTGDLDGNGMTDLVANFQGFGLFAFMNNVVWVHVHPFDATAVAAGDLNANGNADLVMSFPGIGVWVRYDDGTWAQLHPFNATAIVTGNINNDGGNRADVVFHFPGYGIWALFDNTAFAQLHPATVVDFKTGDLNGNDVPDLIVSFQGQGIWVRYDNGTWMQLHPVNPTQMSIGNLDGDLNYRSELVVNFPGFGVWAWLNNTSWVALHNQQASAMAMADFAGANMSEVILHFPGFGLWVLRYPATWTQIHSLAPELMAAGRFDGS